MELKEIVASIGIIRTRANLSARALSLMIGKNASYIHLLESEKQHLNHLYQFCLIL